MGTFNVIGTIRNFSLAVLCGLTLFTVNEAKAQPVPAGANPAGSNSNVLPITIDAGPAKGSVNRLFVNVTVCMPGSTSDCQTIDHVLVDTGSVGLRIFSSAFTSLLPQQSIGNDVPLTECVRFTNGIAWGPIKMADVQLAGERAQSIPIQVIGDPAFSRPADCPGTGTSVLTFPSSTGSARGVLGVGLFLRDCGKSCEEKQATYYGCDIICEATSAPVAKQVQHPVSSFATDNNGIAITLPAVPPGGAPTVTGSLVFGIGTQANNALGSATVQGVNGMSKPVEFHVGDGEKLLLPGGNPAIDNLATPAANPDIFQWGVPFLFGKTVFVAIEGKNTPAGAGPYYAF